MRQITLYARPDCHLCDEARRILDDLISEAADLELIERDIEEDDALLRTYLERIPVIELDGRVIGELVPDRTVLRATLLNTPAR